MAREPVALALYKWFVLYAEQSLLLCDNRVNPTDILPVARPCVFSNDVALPHRRTVHLAHLGRSNTKLYGPGTRRYAAVLWLEIPEVAAYPRCTDRARSAHTTVRALLPRLHTREPTRAIHSAVSGS